MKRGLLSFLLVYGLFTASGQANLDSLLRVLPKAASDSARVLTLYSIGVGYIDSNPDSSMLYGQMALSQAHQANFKRGEALAYVLVGNNLWKRGQYSQAFENHLKALKLFESISYTKGIVSTYNNLALIYEEQHDYKKALENFIKAKDFYERLHDDDNLLIVLMNIGNDYEKINQLDSALFYQGKAHAQAIHSKDKDNIGNILTNLGNIYLKLDQKDLALSHYRSALPYLTLVDDKQVLSEASFGIATIYNAFNEPDSSIAYAKESLSFAKEGSYPKGILIASELLAHQYEKANRIDSAYVYIKNALAIKDTLMDENDMREIQALSMKEQLRQEGMAAEREKAKKERIENLQWLSIALSIIIFFGTLLLLSRRKARPKSLRNLGLLGLLLFFEFISVFLHPFITEITHHIPVFTLLIAVAIASILLPLHHRLEHWVEHTLSHHKKQPAKPKTPVVKKVALPKTESEAKKD